MKKLLALLAAGVMVFSLAACNNNTDVDYDDVTEEQTQTSDLESYTIAYGLGETELTLYKPHDASFDQEDDGEITDFATLTQDDMKWSMFVWAALDSESFVQYYYTGELDEFYSEEYEYFNQEVRDLGITYEGKPVKLIQSTYKEVGEDEEEVLVVAGVEFTDTFDGEEAGDGILGFMLEMYEEIPSDEEYARLFTEVFGLDR